MSKQEHERRDSAVRYRLAQLGLIVRRSRTDGLYRIESRGVKLEQLEAIYAQLAG